MGGWYRKEIKTVDDLKGLKFRIGGWAGAVLTKLGVVPQQIAGGDIYPALEKGTIDAAEWVGPYDDEKLGFYKVAKYYYTPGWWEGQTQPLALCQPGQMEDAAEGYQAIVEAACADAVTWMLGKYDTDNPAALRRLIANGTQLRPFLAGDPRRLLQGGPGALRRGIGAAIPKFKKIYDPGRHSSTTRTEWFRVEEQQFDNFMYSQIGRKSLAVDRRRTTKPRRRRRGFFLPARPI